jgi:hypothetical protein
MARANSSKLRKPKSPPKEAAGLLARRNPKGLSVIEQSIVHEVSPGFICDTESRGHAVPSGRSPAELVVDASEGFIPLWSEHTTLRWRFRERSLVGLEKPAALKARVRKLFGDALVAWGTAAPVRFTEDNDVWDFEIVMRANDDCSAGGCVLASAFFPDAGRHALTLYPMLFQQTADEQVDTLTHEIGHIFGLRHFFAPISEASSPSEIFGTHSKFSIMNYGAYSTLTEADRLDLAELYRQVWSGERTEINGTPIRLVAPFSASGSAPVAKGGVRLAAMETALSSTLAQGDAQAGTVGRHFNTLTSAVASVPVTVEAVLGPNARLGAKLNRQRLTFQNGTARALVTPGQKNMLEWVVVGQDGTPWQIKITEPAHSGCAANGTVINKQASGFCEFSS